MERGQETVISPPAAGITGEGAVLAWSLKGIAKRWKGGLIRGLVCAQELVIKYAIEGCRVSGWVGAREVSYGIKSSVMLGWRRVMSVMIGDPRESTWGSALYSDNIFSIHSHTSSFRRLSQQVRRYSLVRTPPSESHHISERIRPPHLTAKGSAFHTGIPEIKAIIGGYVFDSFLSSWTLLIKALGLALSVSSGLSWKRELGAFGGDFDVMWRGFVTSVIAAVALQYVDPFKTSKLVFFNWVLKTLQPDYHVGECISTDINWSSEDHFHCMDVRQGLYRAYPKAWFFSACPPDPTVRCISPAFYAIIGASSMVAGITRMTAGKVSLVVIVFELTGALSYVLPVMISVMISKWIADALGPDGIYASWIALHRYPWLTPFEFRDNGEIAADAMTPSDRLVVLGEGSPLGELSQYSFLFATREFIVLTRTWTERVLDTWKYHGFPVIRDGILLGYVAREKLKGFIEPLLSGSSAAIHIGSFTGAQGSDLADLSPLLEDVMLLRKEVPLELVMNMFRKLNLRHIMFAQAGKLTGMITTTDIVALSTAHCGALAEERNTCRK
ncbi:hypothetical protein H4582DRAFT_2060950 [Lactarius indigo]|nr:hypothetical protein H4582DRAFT_2060950 [Lactarius indigo]